MILNEICGCGRLSRHWGATEILRLSKITAVVVAVTLALLVPVAVALVGLAYGSAYVPQLMNDMAKVTGSHPFHGLVSNLGAFLWFSTGATLLFTAALLPRHSDSGSRYFLLCSAALTFLLWIDDFFMVHDFWLEQYFAIPQGITFAAGLMLVVGQAIGFRRFYRRFQPQTIMFGVALLASSVLIDIVVGKHLGSLGDYKSLMEDGLKWIGIVVWTWWHVAYCQALITQTFDSSRVR